MKYLIIPFVLFLVGCTNDNEATIKELREVKHDLLTCKASLEATQNALESASAFSNPPQPTKPSEPEYETVSAFHITTKFGSTVCYERNNAGGSVNSEDIACGMTFSDCKDGYIYRCMVDVKYKIIEERKLIEE